MSNFAIMRPDSFGLNRREFGINAVTQYAGLPENLKYFAHSVYKTLKLK